MHRIKLFALALAAVVLAGCSRGQTVAVTNVGDSPAEVDLAYSGTTMRGSVDTGATRSFQLWQGNPPNMLDVTAKWPGHVTHSMVFRAAYPKGNPWRMNVSQSGVVLADGSKMPSPATAVGLALAVVALAWAWRVFRNRPKPKA